jgi:hypothetical protein
MAGGGEESFERALDEARRQDRTVDDDAPGRAGGPRVRASLEYGPAPGSGGEARFGLALDWMDELAEPPSRPAPVSKSEPASNGADTPDEIAAELGLDRPLRLGQLRARWRDFVRRNHPDRQPAHAQERANARVAIANTLYNQARRELARR